MPPLSLPFCDPESPAHDNGEPRTGTKGSFFPISSSKSVSFAKECKVFETIIYISDVTGEETVSIWYNEPSRTKSVSFATDCIVVETSNIDDMTAEEIASTWYQKTDYDNMKHDIQATVLLMECGSRFCNKRFSSRGLENKTSKGNWSFFNQVTMAWNLVLAEQYRQWIANKLDDDRIAQVYAKHSRKSKDAALLRAEQDEKVARQNRKSPAAT